MKTPYLLKKILTQYFLSEFVRNSLETIPTGVSKTRHENIIAIGRRFLGVKEGQMYRIAFIFIGNKNVLDKDV